MKKILKFALYAVISLYALAWIAEKALDDFRNREAVESKAKFPPGSFAVSDVSLASDGGMEYSAYDGSRSTTRAVRVSGKIRNLSSEHVLEEVGLTVIAMDCSNRSECLPAGSRQIHVRSFVPPGEIRAFDMPVSFTDLPSGDVRFDVRQDYGCSGWCPGRVGYVAPSAN